MAKSEPLTADEEHVIAYWMRACRRVRKAIRNMAGRDLWLVVTRQLACLLTTACRQGYGFPGGAGLRPASHDAYVVTHQVSCHGCVCTLDGMQVYIGDGIGMRCVAE